MEPKELLEQLGVLDSESELWMVGSIITAEKAQEEKAVLAQIRYFSYKDNTFYVCRSVGPNTLAIESQFYRDDVDLFKLSGVWLSFVKDPIITLMVESNVFKFSISDNVKAAKKITKLMNEKKGIVL